MSLSQKPALVIASLQVQTSYQAVPLGAACIVSALRSDAYISDRVSVSLADFSLESPSFTGHTAEECGAEIARTIALSYDVPSGGKLPAIAGFSVYVWNRAVFEIAARRLKDLVPGIIVFAGGPEVTADPDFGSASGGVYLPVGIENAKSKNNAPFDVLIRGEGESASRDLVRALLEGKPVPSDIAKGSRSPDEDCSALRSPWLDGTLDGTEAVRDFRGALWELARGCPYNCAYCYESKGSKKVRTFPRERLEKELERFVAAGIERVFVLDPTYNVSRDRAISLLRIIEKKAPSIHFNFEVRAEHLDREMAEAFSRIPCSLQIGLQSSNPEALKNVNRPVDLAQFAKKIGLLNDTGATFGLDLMYGLPGDSLSTFRASLDFALGLYPNNLEIFRLAVLPGTALADRAKEFQLDCQKAPPYHVIATPKFPASDLARAADLARATDVFYTQGRAVSWFLSVLAPLKLKPSQFLQDFALYLADPAVRSSGGPSGGAAPCPGEGLSQADAEKLQLGFLEKKLSEKGKSYLEVAIRNIVALNGAWTRALAEGEESILDLSYDPDDLFSPDAMDIEYFCENVYMEKCRVRIFPTAEGPDYSVFS